MSGDQEASPAAELFELLWESLADVLGTAAAATLLRRAIKRATSHISSAELVIVVRNAPDYEYRLPETWRQPGNEEALSALRAVVAELRLLLIELSVRSGRKRLRRRQPVHRQQHLRRGGHLPGDGLQHERL